MPKLLPPPENGRNRDEIPERACQNSRGDRKRVQTGAGLLTNSYSRYRLKKCILTKHRSPKSDQAIDNWWTGHQSSIFQSSCQLWKTRKGPPLAVWCALAVINKTLIRHAPSSGDWPASLTLKAILLPAFQTLLASEKLSAKDDCHQSFRQGLIAISENMILHRQLDWKIELSRIKNPAEMFNQDREYTWKHDLRCYIYGSPIFIRSLTSNHYDAYLTDIIRTFTVDLKDLLSRFGALIGRV